MLAPAENFTSFDQACARPHPAAPQPANRIGSAMSATIANPHKSSRRGAEARLVTALVSFVLPLLLAIVSVVGLDSSSALACACGCSVFDVGGLDLPQEQDHGGRVFFEFWSGDQTNNYVGSSKAPGFLNFDKRENTQWASVGFSYMFNRDWGVMVRAPYAVRSLTTDTGSFAGIDTS
jgi:hypothetical protein